MYNNMANVSAPTYMYMYMHMHMYSTDQLQGIKRLRFARVQRAHKTRSQISRTRFARGVNAHQTRPKRASNAA